jgi:two-component sensor histidine kinase
METTRRWATWAVIAGCWTVFAFAYSSHLYVYHNLLGEPTTWQLQVAEAFANFGVWAALTPVVLALARRFPLRDRGWLAFAGVHLVAALVISLVQVVVHTVLDLGFIHGQFNMRSMTNGFQALFARTYHFGLLVYAAIIGIHEVVIAYRNQEVRASQLEARLAEAQLEALKMQLNPHFLFNTLHAISALMHKDVRVADRMIARLSEFLRMSLESGNVQEVTLKRELEFLERYLEIEKIRFPDRLVVEMSIDPETLDARVPNLVLQPLVENAIRHGISKRRGAGRIEIRARRLGESLELRVLDDGAGLGESAGGVREGIGLSNTRLRLEQLYGERQTFTAGGRSEGGFEAALSIPFAPFADDALAAAANSEVVDSRAAATPVERAAGEPTWSASAR